MEYPVFREACNTPHYTVAATNMSEERELYTTNELISTSSMPATATPRPPESRPALQRRQAAA